MKVLAKKKIINKLQLKNGNPEYEIDYLFLKQILKSKRKEDFLLRKGRRTIKEPLI